MALQPLKDSKLAHRSSVKVNKRSMVVSVDRLDPENTVITALKVHFCQPRLLAGLLFLSLPVACRFLYVNYDRLA